MIMANHMFRLAGLLRMWQDQRDEHRARLAQAFHADELLGERLDDLDLRRGKLLAQCRVAAGPGELDVERLIEFHRYEVIITARQSEIRRERQQVAAEIDRRRGALAAADREVRVLEKLEERHDDRRRLEHERRETAALDDMAATRFGR
jgi:flagellar protein FliJ